jgi:hypothetical protein
MLMMMFTMVMMLSGARGDAGRDAVVPQRLRHRVRLRPRRKRQARHSLDTTVTPARGVS